MEKVTKSSVKEIYIFPDIEIVEIETEQNILQSGSGTPPDMDPEYW